MGLNKRLGEKLLMPHKHLHIFTNYNYFTTF